jgi:hypothetical protein
LKRKYGRGKTRVVRKVRERKRGGIKEVLEGMENMGEG